MSRVHSVRRTLACGGPHRSGDEYSTTELHCFGHFRDLSYIDLGKAEHESLEFEALNPRKSVPILVIKDGDGNETVLTQSLAILEYLEESLPTLTPLLPQSGDLVQRARVREMVNVITNDIQPITNGRIARRVRAIRDEAKDQITFVTDVFLAGLTAYEKLLIKYGVQFSVGDAVTMADVCFAPAVEMALAYGTNLDGEPRVMELFKRLGELPAFQKGHWKRQGDTPEAMRVS